jgi:hypothetical protein
MAQAVVAISAKPHIPTISCPIPDLEKIYYTPIRGQMDAFTFVFTAEKTAQAVRDVFNESEVVGAQIPESENIKPELSVNFDIMPHSLYGAPKTGILSLLRNLFKDMEKTTGRSDAKEIPIYTVFHEFY